MPETTDAVVIGAGPNGLVAANILADAGWDVVVLESESRPGGSVRSDRGVHPDYVSDLFSSFYPLAVGSPAFRVLELERWGLEWSHAPAVVAHPMRDGRVAVAYRDRERTAAHLEEFGAGDGEAYLRLAALWDRLGEDLMQALLTPFPPVLPTLALLRKVRAAGGLRLLRTLALPVRRLGEEEFRGDGGPLLLAGCALHADFYPESAASAAYGWLLLMLGQQLGWPVPVGGAQALTDALVRRLEARGGEVRCGQPVERVTVSGGRCTGVRTAGGGELRTRRAVLADVPAPTLYGGLVSWDHLPAQLRGDVRRFHWDYATFKVDWALDRRIPWEGAETGLAGTVHLADDIDHLTRYNAQLTTGLVPDRPFALLGQMTTSDPSRSPDGTESAWAYTHLPRHIRDDAGGAGITDRFDAGMREAMADRVEEEVERRAPGFRGSVLARRVHGPGDLERLNPSLVGGAVNGGTAAPHQQLVFRPTPGTGRPETPLPGLYLASSSAHPGGGVHGACGANAARAALRARHPARLLLSTSLSGAQRVLHRGGERGYGDFGRTRPSTDE